MSKMRERVEAGAKLLDEHDPDWADRINLDTLAMRSCSNCILAQVYGGYSEGGVTLGLIENVFSSDIDRSYEQHGFDLYFNDFYTRTSSYEELSDLWRDQIRLRIESLKPVQS